MHQFAEYCLNGWKLCYIPPGSKGPLTAGWQKRDNAIEEADVAEHLEGVGLLHAYSGTCAIDIDDFEQSDEWLAMRGVDLQALWNAPDAVKISSGKPNRGKLLYSLPVPLPSKKVIVAKANIIDFRCATRAGLPMQDVLPGTIHPGTGKPYTWIFDELVTHWSTPPQLPPELHAVWSELITDRTDAAPPAPTGATADAIRQVLALKDPDCDRDTWVAVLSALHYETQGSDEGLALADEWSRKSAKYESFEDVETRWNSFSLTHDKPATFTQDLALIATEDEFAAITPPTTEQVQDEEAKRAEQIEEGNKSARQKARDLLEAALVYVRKLDRYMDVRTRFTLPGDHAVRHTFSSMMPFTRTAAGTKTRVDPVKMLQDSATKQVADVPGFHPGEGLFFTEEGIRYVNEYVAEDRPLLEPTHEELRIIEWLFNRIDDAKFRAWLKQFYGHAIQHPGVKILSAPLLWSETTGNGKSTLLQDVPTLLFGQRYSQAVSHGALDNNHNDYLIGKWFIHLSEMHVDQRGAARKIAAKLKAWITDPLAIHPKGSSAYTTRNSLVITASSNNPDAAAIENNDRRWAIHELRAPRMTEAEGNWVHGTFLKTARAPGVLKHYFMRVDLTGFNPNAPAPETKDREAMIRASMSAEVDVLLDALEDAKGPFKRDIASIQEISSYLQLNGIKYTLAPQKLGRILRSAPLNFVEHRIWSNDAKVRVWVCRNHDQWLHASHKAIETHWLADNDPLTS